MYTLPAPTASSSAIPYSHFHRLLKLVVISKYICLIRHVTEAPSIHHYMWSINRDYINWCHFMGNVLFFCDGSNSSFCFVSCLLILTVFPFSSVMMMMLAFGQSLKKCPGCLNFSKALNIFSFSPVGTTSNQCCWSVLLGHHTLPLLLLLDQCLLYKTQYQVISSSF